MDKNESLGLQWKETVLSNYLKKMDKTDLEAYSSLVNELESEFEHVGEKIIIKKCLSSDFNSIVNFGILVNVKESVLKYFQLKHGAKVTIERQGLSSSKYRFGGELVVTFELLH